MKWLARIVIVIVIIVIALIFSDGARQLATETFRLPK